MRRHIRPVPGWPRILLLTVPVAAAAAIAGAALLFAPHSPSKPAPVIVAGAAAAGAGADSLPAPTGLLVDVTGAVANPGLFRLPKGERVFDAVSAAGGFTADADPAKLPNLAERLRDGLQVKVPSLKTGGTSGTTRVPTVNLNSSAADELVTVPDISASLAAEIISYRTQYGGFASTRELVTVLAMSEADYLIARRYLRL